MWRCVEGDSLSNDTLVWSAVDEVDLVGRGHSGLIVFVGTAASMVEEAFEDARAVAGPVVVVAAVAL